MIDKEKIEKGLRCCIEGDHCNSTDCPYYDAAPNIQGCTQALCQDVFALLKEREAVEPVKMEISGMTNDGYHQYYTYDCGGCGKPLLLSSKYCDQCGREVKWE